jgi:alpha-L-rhamnosidase
MVRRAVAQSPAMDSPPAARNLRADYRQSPIGLDTAPILSWEPAGHQAAYQLECAALGDAGPPGTVTAERMSSSSAHRLELPLTPVTRYRWRVRTWSGPSRGEPQPHPPQSAQWGPWSLWATFESALLDEPGWHGAQWIQCDPPGRAPVLSARFTARGVWHARLYLCGLGIANARVNGRSAGPAVLDPPPSAFDERVWYRVIDVSGLVSDGMNELSVLLGRGWYAMTTPTTFGWHRAPWRAEPKLRALLLDLDRPGEPLLRTGETWTATLSPVRDDSLYTGEVHDFTTPAATGTVRAAAPPRGTLRSCQQPPVTRRERVGVTAHRWTGPDRQRFDLARNVAGMATVTATDTSAPTLWLKLGEKLGPDGEVLAADRAVHGELQRSEFIGVPAGRPVSLELTYAGARYAEVTGTRERVRVDVDRVSAAPASSGHFHCGDDRLSAIHDATRLTLENCLQGTPVDTPLYEKQGYTGDAQLLAETFAYNYWMPGYLASWLEGSVRPSQFPDGSMPGIAPTPPGNWIFDVPSPAWDAALFQVPSTLLRHYADERTARHALPGLRRYLAFLQRRFPAGVVTVGLGDWNPPGFNGAPPEHPGIAATAYYFRFLTLMAGFLRRFGADDEAAGYAARARLVHGAFNAAFRRDDGCYAAPEDADQYRETSNVLALAFGLVPAPAREPLLARVAERVRERGLHLDTGIVGTRFLLPVLTRGGRADLAFGIARNQTYPGWLYWLNNGATTLYENWELEHRSHNHAMFGTIDEWFYRDVAGISPGADGWGTVSVSPHFPSDARFRCAASLDTLAGPVRAEWEKDGRRVRGRVVASSNVGVTVRDDPGLAPVARSSRPTGDYCDEHVFEFEAR